MQNVNANFHRKDKIRVFPCLQCSFATVLCTTLILSQTVKAKYSEWPTSIHQQEPFVSWLLFVCSFLNVGLQNEHLLKMKENSVFMCRKFGVAVTEHFLCEFGCHGVLSSCLEPESIWPLIQFISLVLLKGCSPAKAHAAFLAAFPCSHLVHICTI